MRSKQFKIGFIAVALVVTSAVSLAQSGRTMITTDNAAQLTQLIRLGRGSAESARFTPDGSHLLVGGTAGVWLYDSTDIATESEPALLVTDGETRAIAVNPDGATLAVTEYDGDIVLWDIAAQTAGGTIEPTYGADHIAYTPDGGTLVLNAGSSGIVLLDPVSGSEVQLEGSFRNDSEIAISPDGQWLSATGSDNSLYLWSLANNEAGATLTGHSSTPTTSSFGPDGTLVTGSSDRTIRLWDIAAGTEMAQISTIGEDSIGRITQIVFSPDGSVFASGDTDGKIVIWDAEMQTPNAQLTVDGTVNDLAFSPDGAQLVSVSGKQHVHVWDIATSTDVAAIGHTNSMNALVFSPDSATLAISDFDSNLWLWDTAEMSELNLAASIEDGGNTSAQNLAGVAYSSNGQILATLDSFSVRLYDANTNQLLRELEGDGIVEALAFSPDDTMVAYISSAGLYVFEVETGVLLATLEVHNDWLTSIAWAPDQTLIATAGSDHTVRVYGF